LASFTATYFSRRVHGLVEPAPCFPPGCEVAANVGRVDVQGVELVPGIHPGRGFTLSGNFTVLDETHRPPPLPPPPLKPVDIRPIRVPKHAASARAQYVREGIFAGADRATVSVAYTFFGDRDDLDPAIGRIRSHVGYHRFDAVVSYAPGLRWYRMENEEVFARVQNIFDRNYSEAFGFKAPPINAVAGVKLDF
jgi:outer membrane receptor protein involved in Fe transport